MTLFGKSARTVLSTDEAASDAYTVRKQTPATASAPDSVCRVLGPYDSTPCCLPQACFMLQLHVDLANWLQQCTQRTTKC